jgi:hypothetical protein
LEIFWQPTLDQGIENLKGILNSEQNELEQGAMEEARIYDEEETTKQQTELIERALVESGFGGPDPDDIDKVRAIAKFIVREQGVKDPEIAVEMTRGLAFMENSNRSSVRGSHIATGATEWRRRPCP